MAKEAGSPEQAVSEIEAALRSMELLASKSEPKGAPSRRKGKPERSGEGPAANRTQSGRSVIATATRWLVAVIAICVLPLLVLVRLSVWFYSAYGVWPWISVVGGALAASLALLVFAMVLIRSTTGSFRSPRYLKRFVLGLAAAYCGYSALFVSAANVKTEQVGATFTSLHPSLRLALSTWMLADPRLVITDGERHVEDYALMGLPRNEESLHFSTSSGYVHAVDLRTIGRAEWRNFLTTVYLKSMGFRTRRHKATADHLHVSLPLYKKSPTN